MRTWSYIRRNLRGWYSYPEPYLLHLEENLRGKIRRNYFFQNEGQNGNNNNGHKNNEYNGIESQKNETLEKSLNCAAEGVEMNNPFTTETENPKSFEDNYINRICCGRSSRSEIYRTRTCRPKRLNRDGRDVLDYIDISG